MKLSLRLRPLPTMRPHWLRMFARRELQLLISGDEGGLDVDDMQRHTALQQFGPAHDVVRWFFEVVRELTPQQQRQLMMFATSCSNAPLLGFAYLQPPFTLARQLADNGSDAGDANLPSAASCFNVLRLPVYSSKQALKEKLIIAIESRAGFEFS